MVGGRAALSGVILGSVRAGGGVEGGRFLSCGGVIEVEALRFASSPESTKGVEVDGKLGGDNVNRRRGFWWIKTSKVVRLGMQNLGLFKRLPKPTMTPEESSALFRSNQSGLKLDRVVDEQFRDILKAPPSKISPSKKDD